MYCQQCGTQCPEGSSVCPQCGAVLPVKEAAQQETQVNQQPVQPEQPPVYEQPVYQQPIYQQQNYQQQNYQQPVYSQPPYDPTREVMSVGSYIGVFLLSAIPIVNIICWIVWLVSPNTNRNKKNYVIANIVLFAIGIVLSVLVAIIAGAFGVSIASMY